jgi:hypothetical protein
MTVDELHRQFGMPKSYLDYATKRYLATEAEAQIARQVSNGYRVDPVYEFKTSSNAYEFRIATCHDSSQSRLRPTERFVSFEFELDKPVENVKALLADFPEAVSLCSQGCTIFRNDSSMFEHDGLGSKVYVQPTSPTPDEIKEAGLVAVCWRDEDPKYTWVKGFEFQFGRGGKRIESGSFEIHVQGMGLGDERITATGVWRPSEK